MSLNSEHVNFAQQDYSMMLSKILAVMLMLFNVIIANFGIPLNHLSNRFFNSILACLNAFRAGLYISIAVLYLIPSVYDSFPFHSNQFYASLVMFFVGYVVNIALSFVLFDPGTCIEHLEATLTRFQDVSVKYTEYGSCLSEQKTRSTHCLVDGDHFLLRPSERIAVVASQENLAKVNSPSFRILQRADSPIPYTFSVVTSPSVDVNPSVFLDEKRNSRNTLLIRNNSSIMIVNSCDGILHPLEVMESAKCQHKFEPSSSGYHADEVRNVKLDHFPYVWTLKDVPGSILPPKPHFRNSSRVLLSALSFHSFLEGLALGAQGSTTGILILLPALLLDSYTHTIVLSLGLRRHHVLSSDRMNLIFWSSIFTPLGTLLGTWLTYSTAASRTTYLQPFIVAVGAGSFVFTGMSDAVVSEFIQGRRHGRKLICFVTAVLLLYLELVTFVTP